MPIGQNNSYRNRIILYHEQGPRNRNHSKDIWYYVYSSFATKICCNLAPPKDVRRVKVK